MRALTPAATAGQVSLGTVPKYGVDMESVSPYNDADPLGAHHHTLQWTVHLLRQEPRKAWGALAAMMGAGIVVGIGFRSAGMGALAFVLLWLATREFWLPVRYTISAKGAGMRYLGAVFEVTWDRVKYVTITEDGVKLSPVPPRSRLDPFRGVYLRFADNREQVLEAISFWRNWTVGKTS